MARRVLSDLLGTKLSELWFGKARLDSTNLSADRIVSFPNKAGTIAFLDDCKKTLTFGIRGATTGDRADTAIPLPFAGTILSWKLYSPVSTTAVITIKNDGASIVASAKPTLAGATFAESSTLTGWTPAVAENDILMASVDSTDGQNLILQLVIQI